MTTRHRPLPARRTCLITTAASRKRHTVTATSRLLPPGVRPTVSRDVVLVTGSGRGIGYHTALALASMGCTVYVTDMRSESITSAVSAMNAKLPGADIRAAPVLDLGQQAKVAQFVAEFTAMTPQLDVLINNAGANFMGVEPWHTSQGVAGLPQVNIVGPVNLTMRLLPLLLRSPNPRLVNVASVMHRHAAIPPPDEFLRDWWVGGSYRNCKLVLVALSLLLQKELQSTGLRVVCADPGAVYSGLWSTSKTLGRPPLSWILQALFAPPSDACATVVHCASSPSVEPAGYYARGVFAGDFIVGATNEALSGVLSCCDWPLRQATGGLLFSDVKAVPVSPDAQNLIGARELWDAIADLAGMPCGFKHLRAQAAAPQNGSL